VRVHVHAIADVRAGQMVDGMSRSGQKPPRQTHSEHAAPMPSRIALITCTGALLVGGATGCGSSTPELASTDWPSASASAASPSQTTVTVPTSDENFVRAAQAAGADEAQGETSCRSSTRAASCVGFRTAMTMAVSRPPSQT
jgi:hypothetical protein